MNRAERRNQKSPKSSARKTGLTFLTVAGVVGGSIGLASPAHADVYTSTDCSDLISDLTALEAIGGTLTANFTDTCDFAEGYIFQLPTTIIGPADGSLNLRFTGSSWYGFFGNSDLSVSNLNFTKSADSSVYSFIVSGGNQSLTVSNSTFSDSSLGAAIYAEGNLIVSNSTFENLTSTSGGAAIYVSSNSETLIADSTFTNNQATGQASGGAVKAWGALTISMSTFDSNVAGDQGGAVLSENPATIVNSTFAGNSAMTGAAVVFGEGGVLSNSTFWNNGDADTYSIGTNYPSLTYLFANILANDTPSTVKLIDPQSDTLDLGANLYTDSSFNDTTSGTGSSELVTPADMKLSALALNQMSPTNTGATKTVAIAADSAAYDFYSADSAGINPTANSTISLLLASLDQRGAARPFGTGYDVGAFESGSSPREETEKENLADTGLPTNAGYLGLVGLGVAAILGGSAGLLRRRKKPNF
jgi:LPXTG-motif cell wall-anchored protein